MQGDLSDTDARMMLLGQAAFTGLALGSTFNHLYLAEPMAFLTPAVAALAFAVR